MRAAKPLRTARELESLVRLRIGILPISHLEVRPDAELGWTVDSFGDTRFILDLRKHVDEIANDLRRQFDLRPEPRAEE